MWTLNLAPGQVYEFRSVATVNLTLTVTIDADVADERELERSGRGVTSRFFWKYLGPWDLPSARLLAIATV